ncbi:hypothetical protein PoB_005332600 [Plakobranchus ocellatus]|uniref:Uncharacterized protein n=1 Tax=Plakobranchus ocellatus TaxID=259542 RepID=A0AAV4C643_9GAST|nr:hypothetical protein PoB_005332600 [Plakobranchus ocellatus]
MLFIFYVQFQLHGHHRFVVDGNLSIPLRPCYDLLVPESRFPKSKKGPRQASIGFVGEGGVARTCTRNVRADWLAIAPPKPREKQGFEVKDFVTGYEFSPPYSTSAYQRRVKDGTALSDVSRL